MHHAKENGEEGKKNVTVDNLYVLYLLSFSLDHANENAFFFLSSFLCAFSSLVFTRIRQTVYYTQHLTMWYAELDVNKCEDNN